MDLKGATLTDADLTRANLTNATLTNATLTNANLTDADLTDAILDGSFLDGANLCRTKLTRTSFVGVDLARTRNLTDGQGIRTDFDESCPSDGPQESQAASVQSDRPNEYQGQLPTGDSKVIDIELTEGKDYLVVGSCIECDDLDLTLLDDEGSPLVEDFLVDPLPFVTFRPQSTGMFKIKIHMVACPQPECSWNARVISR